MQQSRYARHREEVLAGVCQEEGGLGMPSPQGTGAPSLLHVYPVRGRRGFFVTDTPLDEEEEEEDTWPEGGEDSPPVVESVAPEPETRPQRKRHPPVLVYYVLMLMVSIVFDNVSMQLGVMLEPTAMITIVTRAQAITAQGTIPGRLLGPVTLSQSASTLATGTKHQEATRASGTLTLYNGSDVSHTLPTGTVLAGQDGVQVMTTQAATIPAAVPPQFGEASVSAQAVNAGVAGNIPAFDVALALSSDLTVKNLAPFRGGQDARDYRVVRQADIDTGAATLTGNVSASMTAALQGQRHAGEALVPAPCTPSVAVDHTVGEEALQIHVTVSMSCTAVAYDTQALLTQAAKVVTTQSLKTIGQGYRLRSPVQAQVTRAPTRAPIIVSFSATGTWLPLLDILHIQRLVAGKPRAVALRLLEVLPGVSHVTLSGLAGDELLPKETDHLHVLIVEETAV